ncbi:beta-lactamase family protein [Catenulispora sp. NF23]|uniref:Beta-lactamase family protein n=1 Tax=Catenulispora pinistramenti TaxID=2705254 RepID=A0ABS5L559_9ACTN|nr:serine hydrolase domain-containing protein [Catenulispora pinistramenti]MBS2534869.1 beta-lactamase family protein [Catenulispora pinistramenti]MBS2553375.1 beta-lactamase family protein [Catenulispora pinistramenti]
MAQVQGTYTKEFAPVADALSQLLDADDIGASAAVFVHGEPVVDVWGGHVDAERTVAWERDTIVNVMSTTKPMTALCALILADRGELDLSAPVSAYWPEFAAAGKENVLVRHLLSHTAGLADWPGKLRAEDLYDWAAVTERLAAMATQWEPGTAAGYHSMTFGFLVGEVVRRITGRSLGRFFAEEVAGPLGADFHIGLDAQDDSRVARLYPPPSHSDDFSSGGPDSEAAGGIRVRDANTEGWRRAEIPAANGFGNARGIALAQSVLSNGGVAGGVRLLSPEGCETAWHVEYAGEDRVMGQPATYGMGFGVFGDTFGWGGWGGSLVMNDHASGMTVAYAMNQMLDPREQVDERGLKIVAAAYEALR